MVKDTQEGMNVKGKDGGNLHRIRLFLHTVGKWEDDPLLDSGELKDRPSLRDSVVILCLQVKIKYNKEVYLQWRSHVEIFCFVIFSFSSPV